MKTACIYHSRDLDGWMSAAIVKFFWSKDIQVEESALDTYLVDLKDPRNTLTFIGYDYGQPIPDLSKYDKVIMCDVSFPKEEMFKLEKNLIWIDHHSSSIKDIDPENGFYGLRDTNFAACELTWKYFFPNETIPEIIRFLGLYDSFRSKGTEEHQKVLEFQYGARNAINNYNTAYDYLLYNIDDNKEPNLEIRGHEHVINTIFKNGISIYEYLCTEARQDYKKGFEIKFNQSGNPVTIVDESTMLPKTIYPKQYKFICFNKQRFNPINFGIDYHKDGYDGAACFWYDNGNWIFSLYNDNGEVDCSDIAKQYGGGGHKGAAGFVTKDINFMLK